MEQVKQYLNPITLGRTSAVFSSCPLLLCKNFAYETLVIHRWTFDIQWSYMKDLMTLLHCVCAVQGTLNLKWRSELYWRVCQCLKQELKIKWDRATICMKLRFARSIKRWKGSRFTTKVLAKIQIRWVAWLWFFNFTLCLHLLHCNFIRVTFDLIFRSGFPSVQQICQWFFSCLARTSIGRLQYWNFLFEHV